MTKCGKWSKCFNLYNKIFPLVRNLRGTTRLKNFLLKQKLREEDILRKVNTFYEFYCDNLNIKISKNFKIWLVRDFLKILKNDYTKEYTPKKGDVVIDAGAFPGYFTIYLSKLIGENGKVIAFEPDKRNIRELNENIQLNDCKNVKIIEKGIWNEEGVVGFEGNGEGAHISEDDGKKIKTTTIDKEIESKNLKTVDFIKMDIEGAEIKALRGAKKTLEKYTPKLVIASYHIVNGEKTYKKVEEILSKFGYSVNTRHSEYSMTYAEK